MKNVLTRLFGLCLSFLLVFSLIPQRAYAASGSLSASSSTLRAGNSFTVYLSVSGSNVAGIEASMSYDSSTLTYNGYKNSLGGSWVLSESSRNFTMYNSSGDTFSGSKRVIALSFTVKSSASTGAAMSVSVSGKASENGADSSFSASWSGKVAAPLSGDATLKDLWCDNADLDFTGGTEYSITVPYEVSSLDLDWSRSHSGSKVEVSGNSLSVGSNTVTVTVKAENGTTKRYYIYVTREQDPNYVPSTDATLSALTPSTGKLSPAFSTDVTDYVLYIPYEVTELTFRGEAHDSKALGVATTRKVLVLPEEESAEEGENNTGEGAEENAEPEYRTLSDDEPLPEGETIYIVTCTAEDGTTTKDYTVHVIRMPVYEGMLPEIIPPVTEPEPEPEPTTFDISLPLVLTLPYIGEVTLQQAALGALIALGVILLLLLIIAWAIGRRGGRKKALRQLAKANAQSDAPAEPLLDRLAAEDAAAATAAAVVTAAVADEPAAEEPAAEEDASAEEKSPVEEVPAEEAPAAEEAAPAEEAIPAMAVTEVSAEELAAEELAAPEEAPIEEAPAEEEAPVAEELAAEEPVAQDEPAPVTPDTMSLDELLEDIRNM
ncbi:MAG: cadherin-like beta sandwich domain-containing protein [Ruminococcaceae bacterium]|nr:cadherin-like beta sandwich domain-containing protein [Oscillospiraceae bacterium]